MIMRPEPEDLTTPAAIAADCAMASFYSHSLPIKKRYLYDLQDKSYVCHTQLPRQSPIKRCKQQPSTQSFTINDHHCLHNHHQQQQQQHQDEDDCNHAHSSPCHLNLHDQDQIEALDLCVYKCRTCLKCFKAKDRLKAHMRRHEIKQSKRYTCEFCKKSFVQQSSLITHKRIHTGEKPFYCVDCGNSYGDQSTFTKHTRTHTGEKPYQCNFCYQRFSQSGNLSRHKKSVHNFKK